MSKHALFIKEQNEGWNVVQIFKLCKMKLEVEDHELFLKTQDGSPLQMDKFYRKMFRLCREVNIAERITANCMRRSAVSILIGKMPLEKVTSYFGWRSVITYSNYYSLNFRNTAEVSDVLLTS